MPRPPSSRLLYAAAAGCVALAGCVRLGPPPVGVQRLASSVVFSTAPPPPAPPNLAPPLPAPPAAAPGIGPATAFTVDLAPSTDEPVYHVAPALAPPPSPCPSAGPNAYPSVEAPDNATGLPAAGSYRWKRSGTFQLNLAPGQTLTSTGFDTRLVRNVQPLAPDGSEFTFETVQPDVKGDSVISDWQVKTNGVSVTPAELSVSGTNVGDPERGLALKGQTVVGPDGHALYHYAFTPGVLFAPLPIQPGLQFQGVGVDPASGETLTVDGTVGAHQRVDACGDILDGWQINTTETFSGATSQPATYNYVVATQLGGLIVGEHVDTTTADGHFVFDYTLGQLKPGPLP